MVGAADADEILKVRGAPLGPVGEVVSMTPRRRPVAAGPDATPVTGPESSARRGRGHPSSPTHVEHGGRAVEDHPGNGGIAAQPADRLASDGPAPLELARGRAVPTGEGVECRRDLKVRSPATAAGEQPRIHDLPGELHEGVGEPAVVTPEILGPVPARKWFQGCAQGGAGLAVQKTTEEQGAPDTRLQLQVAGLHLLHLLDEEAPLISSVPRVLTVVAELPNRVHPRLGEEWTLLETVSGPRPGDRLGRPRQQSEVVETNLTAQKGLRARRKLLLQLADVERVDRRGGGRPALVLHPLDGAQVPLPLRLVAASERRHIACELELEDVDDVASAEHPVPQGVRGTRLAASRPKDCDGPLHDGEGISPGCDVVGAVTHAGSIANRCAQGNVVRGLTAAGQFGGELRAGPDR